MARRSRGASNVSPAERPIIAVLPLQNLSAEPDSDYFVDGLTDEIIRNLAAIKGLEVRSRTSSFAFKDKARNLRDVGEQLGVNLVVEGSIMRSGSRLRINAQLVQVAGEERTQRLIFLSVEPTFDGLRGDPRFAALRSELGLP